MFLLKSVVVAAVLWTLTLAAPTPEELLQLDPVDDDTVEEDSTEDEPQDKTLTFDDFFRAGNLSNDFYEIPDDINPLELAGAFEGDIKGSDKIGRNAVRDKNMLWQGGKIPYVVSREFDKATRSVIARAIQEYHDKTCIRFVPRRKEKDYIKFVRGSGCYAYPGRDGGMQEVSIGQGCGYVGVVLHELMHTLGFYHEQSRTDRDEHINIVWNNILPGADGQFAKYTQKDIQHLGEPYDYESIMHYGPRAFALFRSRATIVPRKPGVRIGQRKRFSSTDLRKINKLYQCSRHLSSLSGEGGMQDSNAAPVCRDRHRHCSLWAQYLECQANPLWMLPNCPKSCQQC